MPSGSKPLPEPMMMIQIYVAIWCNQATMSSICLVEIARADKAIRGNICRYDLMNNEKYPLN